jgi:hypothetical protein
VISKVSQIRPGTIELTTSWEVLFNPFKSCRERSGGIDNMMTEIGNVMYRPEAPTWRDDVGMVGHFDKSIRFSWEPTAVRVSTLCPTSREAFQDWIMGTMQEMGYEGWSVVDRVVTAQASDE